MASFITRVKQSTKGAFNFGGTNATGQVHGFIFTFVLVSCLISNTTSIQVPSMGNFGLIDHDTPQSAYTRTSWKDESTEMQLVFSDEFNVDGRSFYPGEYIPSY